ncbi:MAG: hypothetical protein ACYC7A_05490 [Thermoanaerobaculia bacterium]
MTQPTTLTALLDRIASRTAEIGVIGLGYVGLPLALLFRNPTFVPPTSLPHALTSNS